MSKNETLFEKMRILSQNTSTATEVSREPSVIAANPVVQEALREHERRAAERASRIAERALGARGACAASTATEVSREPSVIAANPVQEALREHERRKAAERASRGVLYGSQ